MLKGYVTICKVYSDGTEEIVLDKENIITAGLGYSLVDLNQGAGSTFPADYTPHYFQLGTSTIDYDTTVATSSFFYQVSTPFDWSAYGADTDLEIVKLYRGFIASCTDTTVIPPVCSSLFLTSSLLSSTLYSGVDEYFSRVQPGTVTKVFLDSVEAEIILDENSANGQAITEIGLFAKNPKGFNKDSPFLMAYRSFTALNKTAEFSLVIHWNIGFLGISNIIDDKYTGGSLITGGGVGGGGGGGEGSAGGGGSPSY